MPDVLPGALGGVSLDSKEKEEDMFTLRGQ